MSWQNTLRPCSPYQLMFLISKKHIMFKFQLRGRKTFEEPGWPSLAILYYPPLPYELV